MDRKLAIGSFLLITAVIVILFLYTSLSDWRIITLLVVLTIFSMIVLIASLIEMNANEVNKAIRHWQYNIICRGINLKEISDGERLTCIARVIVIHCNGDGSIYDVFPPHNDFIIMTYEEYLRKFGPRPS